MHTIYFGGGCFWCIEAPFKLLKGVVSVVSGYMGGHQESPDYESICSGTSGHAEVIKIVFDQQVISLDLLLQVFFLVHDPTEKNRQGNDVGTQYRSVIYTNNDDDLRVSLESKEIYQKELVKNNFKADSFESITTEIEPVKNYYLAEEYHQQYLAKNPNGYCGIGGTGCSFPKE